MNVLVAGGLLLQHGLENYEALANNLASGGIDNNTLKAMQIAVSLGMFFLPAFLFAYMKGEKAFSFLQLSFKPSWQLLLLVVPIVLLAAPFIAAMLELNQQMSLPAALSQLEQYLKTTEQANEQMLKKLLIMNTPSDFLINMLMVAVIPALGEEIFFRGCLQRVLTDLYRNAYVAIIMGAIIFSFIHFQFYGFLPRMILGVLFGYMLLWTGNLWYSVLAHFLHNGLQVTVLYLFQQKIITYDIEATQSVSPVLAFGATAILFYVLAMFQKKSGSIV
jgi:membrane protease YdiL (CAAX protease family)